MMGGITYPPRKGGGASVYLKFPVFGSILEKVFNGARFPNSHNNLVCVDMLDCLFAGEKENNFININFYYYYHYYCDYHWLGL